MAVDTSEEYMELMANEWGNAMGELEDLDLGETRSRHGLLNDILMVIKAVVQWDLSLKQSLWETQKRDKLF